MITFVDTFTTFTAPRFSGVPFYTTVCRSRCVAVDLPRPFGYVYPHLWFPFTLVGCTLTRYRLYVCSAFGYHHVCVCVPVHVWLPTLIYAFTLRLRLPLIRTLLFVSCVARCVYVTLRLRLRLYVSSCFARLPRFAFGCCSRFDFGLPRVRLPRARSRFTVVPAPFVGCVLQVVGFAHAIGYRCLRWLFRYARLLPRVRWLLNVG